MVRIQDTRSKEQLKADGDYTPEYWRRLLAERGVEPHGQRHPKKHRQSTVERERNGTLI